MKNLLFILILLFLFDSLNLIAQETLSYEYVNTEGDIAFKKSDGKSYTGIVQSKKQNGQVKFEFEFDNGKIIAQYVYYTNKKNKGKLAAKVLYHPEKPWRESTQIRYLKKYEKWTFYDVNGNRTLTEHRKNKLVIYSCEYAGRKRHGQEMWLNDDGTKIFVEYVNGREKNN